MLRPLLLAGMTWISAMAGAAEVVHFPGPDRLTLSAHIQMPRAQSKPIPAIVFLHGCGGIGRDNTPNPRHQAAMDWAVDHGYAALLVNSLTPRGERELCTQKFSNRKVRTTHRAEDAYSALDYLATRKEIDATRVALWGWSHGGSTVLEAMRAPETTQKRSFAASIAFYPGCTAFNRPKVSYTLRAPLHLFVGEADDWTPASPCKQFVEHLATAQQPASITAYPGAYHDFDNPDPKFKKRVRTEVPNGVNPGDGVTVAPDPAARTDAMARAEKFLKQHLSDKS
jgi:dienelactone hydrolase